MVSDLKGGSNEITVPHLQVNRAAGSGVIGPLRASQEPATSRSISGSQVERLEAERYPAARSGTKKTLIRLKEISWNQEPENFPSFFFVFLTFQQDIRSENERRP